MAGKLCWLSKFGSNGELILHLQLEPHQPWKPYTHYPGVSVPDYPIARGSKGWATCQKLLQAGWTLIPNDQTQSSWTDNSSAA